MLDVFNEESEVIVKDGIANLYWYRADLKKCWLRSRVPRELADRIYRQRREDGGKITKRVMMDRLYEELRDGDYNRRLEVSRNFVRVLVEQQSFVPQSENHRIEIAERCTLKLRELVREQDEQRSTRRAIKHRNDSREPDYYSKLKPVSERFNRSIQLPKQRRGYELQEIFRDLMEVSKLPVERPFRVKGEEIDGAFKYEGHYYLVELRWRKKKASPSDVGAFHFKVEGSFDQRGIFVSMNGFSSTVAETVPKGRAPKVLLLDGSHIANVLAGLYTFPELMEHARRTAVHGEIYSSAADVKKHASTNT